MKIQCNKNLFMTFILFLNFCPDLFSSEMFIEIGKTKKLKRQTMFFDSYTRSYHCRNSKGYSSTDLHNVEKGGHNKYDVIYEQYVTAGYKNLINKYLKLLKSSFLSWSTNNLDLL